MKKGKIAKTMTIAMTTAMTMALTTGCVDQMPEMTQEQTDLIAEYAANLLLKYSPNYNYKIVDEQELEEIVETTEENLEESGEIKEEQVIQEATDTDTQSQQVESQETEEIKELLMPQEAEIAEFLNVENFEIEYASYEIVNAYPKETSGFAVSAPEGKKLLVLHYDITNLTDDKATCELLEKEATVFANVNETGYREAMNTLLVNDFASYMEEFAAKETKEIVSIIAVPEEIEEVETLEFQLRVSNQEITVKVE